MAFFDPNNKNHKKARDNLKIYDKEKIIVDQTVISEVVNWLSQNNKHELIEWWFDYLQNTANVRVFHFGKEEFEIISKICIEQRITSTAGAIEYLNKYLNCDVTREF